MWTTTTPLLLMIGRLKISKRRFPHDTQVKVLTDFSSCAYFWCRVGEREHPAKQCKELRTPAKCATLWHSLSPTHNICFLTWPPSLGLKFEQFSSAEGLPSSRVPLGEAFIQEFWEQEPFHNLNYHRVNLHPAFSRGTWLAWQAAVDLSETKLNCHQCLCLNDSSNRGYFLIIGFLSNQTRDLTLEQIKPCQD